jgi:hypothetical protein
MLSATGSNLASEAKSCLTHSLDILRGQDRTPQAGRLGAVVEDVAEMAAAAAAMYGRAHRAEGSVPGGADRALQRRPEARPARAAVILGGRGKHIKVAAHADKISAPFLVQQWAGEWAPFERFSHLVIAFRDPDGLGPDRR